MAVDGRPMESVPQFASFLLLHDQRVKLKVDVLRGQERITLEIPVIERREESDQLADLVNPEKNLVSKLGIVGLSIDEKIAPMLEDLRINTGVVVAAMTESVAAQETGLTTGDIIHSVNGVAIQSVESLRDVLDKVKSGSTVALQIERDGQLQFVTFEIE